MFTVLLFSLSETISADLGSKMRQGKAKPELKFLRRLDEGGNGTIKTEYTSALAGLPITTPIFFHRGLHKISWM